MTTLHVTSVNNVETTLNQWFHDQLTYIDLPQYPVDLFGKANMTDANFAYEWPETPLAPPCFSFNHIPVMAKGMYQGNVGSDSESAVCSYAIFEINAWVNRDTSINWRPQLQVMRSMIEQVYARFPVVVIQDTLVNPGYPEPTSYKIDLGDMNNPATLPESGNPGIRRARYLINYSWRTRSIL